MLLVYFVSLSFGFPLHLFFCNEMKWKHEKNKCKEEKQRTKAWFFFFLPFTWFTHSFTLICNQVKRRKKRTTSPTIRLLSEWWMNGMVRKWRERTHSVHSSLFLVLFLHFTWLNSCLTSLPLQFNQIERRKAQGTKDSWTARGDEWFCEGDYEEKNECTVLSSYLLTQTIHSSLGCSWVSCVVSFALIKMKHALISLRLFSF